MNQPPAMLYPSCVWGRARAHTRAHTDTRHTTRETMRHAALFVPPWPTAKSGLSSSAAGLFAARYFATEVEEDLTCNTQGRR